MKTIAASSYSNTAPLIWSFLYGSQKGRYEVILDNAPARSAQLLAENYVDAALVPVITAHMIENVKLIPDVCVGAKDKVRSVCLFTRDKDLSKVKSVSLDVSSKTSVVLTKIVFREFLGFEPIWKEVEPNLKNMLAESDCALLIGDPALEASSSVAGDSESNKANSSPELPISKYQTFDLVEVWRKYTGLGFVFAMWMTLKEKCKIDFAGARDEGLEHLDEITANYEHDIPLSRKVFKEYLANDISFAVDDSMQKGMELYFELAEKHGLIVSRIPLTYL